MQDLFVSWKEGRLKVGSLQKSMSVKYSPVAIDASGETPHGSCRTHCTKRNIVAVLVILTLATFFIVSACVGSTWINNSKFCPDKSQVTVKPQIHPLRKRPHHYPGAKRRLPDCIIIGVRKGGTRALINYLNMHPDVAIAPEEIHFFDDQQNYSKGIDWYRRQMPFSFSEQVIIEKTPNYFVDDRVPARIQNLSSSIKLILIVRDPLYRTVSDYAQIRERRLESGGVMEDFEELAFQDDGEVISVDTVNTNYKAINRSLYYFHIQKWLQHFNLTHIHIVDGDNMVLKPLEEIRKVETFLSLDHKIKPGNLYFDRKKGFFCIKPDNKRPKCLNKTKGRQHPPIDKDVRAILNEFFEPWNRKFYALVGRTFKWPLNPVRKRKKH